MHVDAGQTRPSFRAADTESTRSAHVTLSRSEESRRRRARSAPLPAGRGKPYVGPGQPPP